MALLISFSFCANLCSLFFSLQLCEINDLEKRLDLLLVIMEFPTQFEDLAPVSRVKTVSSNSLDGEKLGAEAGKFRSPASVLSPVYKTSLCRCLLDVFF